MCMLNALAHQSSMQELDLLNPQPDPRITYSGGPKTFVGSNGLLQESPSNLLLWSNDPSNAAWTKSGVLVTPNALALRGVNFSKVEATATGGLCYQPVLGAGSARGNTVSFLVKKGSGATVMNRFTFRNDTTATNFLTFTINLDTGAITHAAGSGATAQSMGDGIWRVTASNTAFINDGDNLRLYIGFGSGTTFSVGDYSYIANLQMQKGSVATEYIATTTAVAYAWPLEYDPITLKPIGRSVWEQRTNVETNSETLSGYTRSSLTATASGTLLGLTAFALVEAAATGLHFLSSPTASFTAGATYTISRVVKSAGRNASLAFPAGAFGASVRWTYDLVAGTASRNVAGTNDVGTITALGGGVYLITLTAQATATASGQVGMYVVAGTAVSYAGDGVSGLLVAAHQTEAGAFASPYIPTAGSQVTRVADVADVTETDRKMRHNIAGMTAYAEGVCYDTVDAGDGSGGVGRNALIMLGDGLTDQAALRRNDTGTRFFRLYGYIRDAVAPSAVLEGADNSFAPNVLTKAALGLKPGAHVAAAGGALIGPDTSVVAIPTAKLKLGRGYTSSIAPLNGVLRKVRFYPARLSNSELQALTA